MAGPDRNALYPRPSGSRSFIFHSEQPTMTAILTGLAVLCFLLIVRIGLQRGVAWVRQSRSRRFSYTQAQMRPAPPILDEKMRETSRCRNRPDSEEQRSSAGESNNTSMPFPTPVAVPGRQQRRFLARLPPPPPLTPPELSTTIFACNADVDGFISQPNPDYMSATSSVPLEDAQPTPRRRSYMKTFTIGTPIMASEDGGCPDRSSGLGSRPSSPLFPPPSGLQSQMRARDDDASRRNVDVKGEIISLVNQDGEGWSRHTRVYGGGACLACAASGGQEGGFYGTTVTPEEMRY